MPSVQDPEIFRAVLESIPIGVYLTDLDGRIVFWNMEAERITGYLRQEVVGRPCSDNLLVQCEGQSSTLGGDGCPTNETMRNGKPCEMIIYLRHKAGHRIPVRVRTTAVRDGAGAIAGCAQLFEECAGEVESRQWQSRLAAYGSLDEMTGVPNRAFTELRLNDNFNTQRDWGIPWGILKVRVDGLNHMRADYGREAADEIVCVIAHSLKNALRPTDYLGRWADDQFLALVTDCDRAALEQVSARLKRVVSCSDVRWWGDRLSTTISIGIAEARPGDTAESILARAER